MLPRQQFTFHYFETYFQKQNFLSKEAVIVCWHAQTLTAPDTQVHRSVCSTELLGLVSLTWEMRRATFSHITLVSKYYRNIDPWRSPKFDRLCIGTSDPRAGDPMVTGHRDSGPVVTGLRGPGIQSRQFAQCFGCTKSLPDPLSVSSRAPSGRWQQMGGSDGPTARFSMVAGISGDHFYVSTGQSRNGVFLNDIWRLDLV